MNKTLRGAAATAVLMASLLSGCANNPTTVATVDGHTITESQVEPMAQKIVASQEEMNSDQKMTLGEARLTSAQVQILDTALPTIYRKVGLTYDPAAIEKAFTEGLATVTDPVAKSQMGDATLKKFFLVQGALNAAAEKVGKERVMAAISEVVRHANVNPRYASLLNDKELGSLSTKWMPPADAAK